MKKNGILSLLALIIAVGSLVVNYWIVSIMKKEMDLRLRPHIGVYAVSCDRITETNEIVIFRIKAVNVGALPAAILQYSCQCFSTDGDEKIGAVTGKDISIVRSPNQGFLIPVSLTKKRKELIYQVNIEYGDVDHLHEYFYREKGKYNAESNLWQALESTAK